MDIIAAGILFGASVVNESEEIICGSGDFSSAAGDGCGSGRTWRCGSGLGCGYGDGDARGNGSGSGDGRGGEELAEEHGVCKPDRKVVVRWMSS